MSIEQRVILAVAHEMSLTESEIWAEHSLVDDIGADTIDLVHIDYHLQDEFGKDFEVDAVCSGKLQSVQDIIDHIEAAK